MEENYAKVSGSVGKGQISMDLLDDFHYNKLGRRPKDIPVRTLVKGNRFGIWGEFSNYE